VKLSVAVRVRGLVQLLQSLRSGGGYIVIVATVPALRLLNFRQPTSCQRLALLQPDIHRQLGLLPGRRILISGVYMQSRLKVPDFLRVPLASNDHVRFLLLLLGVITAREYDIMMDLIGQALLLGLLERLEGDVMVLGGLVLVFGEAP